MKKAKLILLAILISYLNLTAQQLTDSIGNFLILPSVEIPSNQINTIELGYNGNLYAGTRVGLAEWNGNKWNLFKTDNRRGFNRVIDFDLDTNSVVWSVFNSSSLYILKNGVFNIFEYTKQHAFYEVEISKNNIVYTSVSDKVLKINPITQEYTEITIPNDDVMWYIKFDNNNNLWGQNFYGDKIFEIQNDSLITHRELNGISVTNIYALSIIDTNYYAIITQNSFKLFSSGSYTTINPPITGDFWVSSFKFSTDSTLLLSCEKGAYYYKNGNWSRLDTLDYARNMCKVTKDSICVAYNYDGITMGSSNNRTQYRGPALDEIRSLEYFNNTLFIGADNSSVSQWDGLNITTKHCLSPIFYKSNSLSISNNNKLYASGSNGIFRYNKGSWESIIKLYNLPDRTYLKCAFGDNNLMYTQAYTYGLYVIDSTGIINCYDRTNSLLGYVSGGILYDSKGRLWIGSYDEYFWEGELYMLKDDIFTKYEIPNCTGQPMSILEDNKGDIWVGCSGTDVDSCSLAKYDGTKWDTIHYETKYDNMNYLEIFEIYEDYKGNIWLATGNGAYMYNGKKWERIKEFGYFEAIFFSVTGDKLGNIYLGSYRSGTYVMSYYNGIIEPNARKLQNLEAYPNPTTGSVNLKLQHSGESTISVYNQQGSMVYSEKAYGNTPNINLNGLAKGQYIINVIQDEYFSTSTIILTDY